MNDDDSFLSLRQIEIKYDITLHFTQVWGIHNAIPIRWKRCLKDKRNSPYQHPVQYFSNIKSVSSTVYRQLNEKDLYQESIAKWQKAGIELSKEQLARAVTGLYIITNVSRLRSFQFCLLHKAITTNIHLVHYKLLDTNVCTFCQRSPETLEHLFYSCEIVRDFWSKVFELFQSQINEIIEISFKKLLLNNITADLKLLPNFLILLRKHFIYVKRCEKKNLSFENFKAYIYSIKEVEECIAKNNNKLSVHKSKWSFF